MKSGLLFLALLCSAPAGASIGLNASNVPADCKQLRGTYSVITPDSVYQCAATGVTVKFYANSQNLITRITWNGRHTPALNVLLGSFSDEYTNQYRATKMKGLRRSVHVESDHVNVIRAGNARAHVGEIVLKAATP